MIRPISLAAACAVACTTPPATRPDATPLACATPTIVAIYRVDSIHLGSNQAEVDADAFDVVNNDGSADNELGLAFESTEQQLAPDFAPDPIADASFAGSVDWEIVTETCDDSGETRVRVGSLGGTTPRAGGSLAAATLRAAHGCAEVPIGAIAGGSDAGWVVADQMALDVAIGSGELSGTIGFALDQPDTSTAIALGIAPFLTQELSGPNAIPVSDIFDPNGDGVVTPAEVLSSPLYVSLLAPDGTSATRPPGDPQCPPSVASWISFGLHVHAVAQ